LKPGAVHGNVLPQMAEGKSERHWEATALLVLLLIAAGVFAFLAQGRLPGYEVVPVVDPALTRTAGVDFDRFSALRERTPDGEQLRVSLRLRNTSGGELPCFVFVVARNDQSTPKVWAVWPPQAPGVAVTSGGHFHGADPRAGHPMTLSGSWQRVTATLPYPASSKPYNTVSVYVVGNDGRVLLARPFGT
jgi:hypothetical protein